MNKKEYKILADKICRKTGFVAEEIIYTGSYYKKENVRNVIFSGSYKNKPAVLKIYNDKRLTDEPLSLKYFNDRNKSKILSAPELYDYEVTSFKRPFKEKIERIKLLYKLIDDLCLNKL